MQTQRISTRKHLAPQLALAAIGIALLSGFAQAQDQRARATTATRVGDTPDRNAIARQITVDQPDLVIESPSVNASSNVAFVVRNRSSTASTTPFVMDVYVDGRREDTIKHGAVPGHAEQAVISSLARLTKCDPATIRVVADAQLVVTEFDERNNETSVQLTPPCPDFAVSITKNWEDANLRYRAHVTITNIGNAPSPAGMIVRVIGSTEGLASIVDATGLPLNDTRTIDALAPGASQSFNSAGKFLGTSTLYVKVLVDFFKTVRESNENNNVVDKKL